MNTFRTLAQSVTWPGAEMCRPLAVWGECITIAYIIPCSLEPVYCDSMLFQGNFACYDTQGRAGRVR